MALSGSNSFPARSRGRGAQAGGGGGGERGDGAGRREARFDRWFSGLELRIGPGSLRDMDPARLKGKIKRWAKAVVAYARQISFGSPRSSRLASSPTPSAPALRAPMSAPSLGSVREEPPPT